MAAGDHNISFIAHYTAQAWVRDRLPWAWRFDTRAGRVFYELVEPLCTVATWFGFTTPPDFLIQRHRVMDALIQRAAPAQVVELAGGLSPRCVALSHKLGIRCVDVDLPGMVELKAALLRGAAPGEYRQASLDLVASRDYLRDLEPTVLRRAPTVVVTEGILPYFPQPVVQQVFNGVAGLLRGCGGGTYLTDIYHQEAVDSLRVGELFRRGLHLLARSPRYPMLRDFAEADAMLRRAGFREVVAHHPRDWQRELALPVRRRDSGLRVYEARL